MLNEDYKEMLQLLLEDKVDFMIVGAYALGDLVKTSVVPDVLRY